MWKRSISSICVCSKSGCSWTCSKVYDYFRCFFGKFNGKEQISIIVNIILSKFLEFHGYLQSSKNYEGIEKCASKVCLCRKNRGNISNICLEVLVTLFANSFKNVFILSTRWSFTDFFENLETFWDMYGNLFWRNSKILEHFRML